MDLPSSFQGYDDDEDDAVDTNLMRQRELQSKLFGRPHTHITHVCMV